MDTIQDFLNRQSNILNGSKVKLVRHTERRANIENIVFNKANVIEYQGLQKSDIFKDCNYIVSFLGLKNNACLFIGVYKVISSKTISAQYCYDLEHIEAFENYEDRLIIDWGNSGISWHQWYDKQPKNLIKILEQKVVSQTLTI